MSILIHIGLLTPALIIFGIVSFFLCEVLGSFLPRRKQRSNAPRDDKIAVIIPAHNEESGIIPTLEDVKGQLKSGDRLIVVADNCSDSTAEIVRAADAQCLVRNDTSKRGKGYALQFALDALKSDPPDVVIMVDADCRLSAELLEKISWAALSSGRPVQALYLMQPPEEAPHKRRVAAFAWMLINRVRMSGLYNLFGATRLTGAGMAFPWALAEQLELGSGEIVEDLSLSVDLIRKGNAPIFFGDGVVTSVFPDEDTVAAKQSARWEHGSRRLALRAMPALIWNGIKKWDAKPIAMAFDLAIPPLSLFCIILFLGFVVSIVAGLVWGIAAPFLLMTASCVIFSVAIIIAWAGYGRTILPISAFGEILLFLVAKRKVYDSEARESTKTWTRTKRTQE